EVDRIVGLEMGADDYLSKPFSPRELLARIRSILRRTRGLSPARGGNASSPRVRFAGWTLDFAARQLVAPDGVVVSLSGAEFKLLSVFVEHPNRVLDRNQLMDLTVGRDGSPFDRSIDVQVGRLRLRPAPPPGSRTSSRRCATRATFWPRWSSGWADEAAAGVALRADDAGAGRG